MARATDDPPSRLCSAKKKKTAKKKKKTPKKEYQEKKKLPRYLPEWTPISILSMSVDFRITFVRSFLVDKFCSYIDFDSFLLQHIMFNLFQSVLHQCWFYWTIFATAKRWAIVLPRDSFSLFISSFQLPLSLSTYAD